MDHHIPKPLRLDVLAAECTKLGLLPRADTQLRIPAAAVEVDTPRIDGARGDRRAQRGLDRDGRRKIRSTRVAPAARPVASCQRT